MAIPRDPPTPQFTAEAVDTFLAMKEIVCTCTPRDWAGRYWEHTPCAGCEKWWALHSRLVDLWPGAKPWWWPIVEDPDSVNPYPPDSPVGRGWKPDAEAVARWRVIEAASAGLRARRTPVPKLS
jgi:hypothetical protein